VSKAEAAQAPSRPPTGSNEVGGREAVVAPTSEVHTGPLTREMDTPRPLPTTNYLPAFLNHREGRRRRIDSAETCRGRRGGGAIRAGEDSLFKGTWETEEGDDPPGQGAEASPGQGAEASILSFRKLLLNCIGCS